MGAVTYTNAGFRERIEEICHDIVGDPQRSVYVKPRTLKNSLRHDFPDMSDGQLGNNAGRVLKELDYVEKWGGETYMIHESEM
jgi:hypothetical protein